VSLNPKKPGAPKSPMVEKPTWPKSITVGKPGAPKSPMVEKPTWPKSITVGKLQGLRLRE
jgi:hypothetical protein